MVSGGKEEVKRKKEENIQRRKIGEGFEKKVQNRERNQLIADC